ncbi:MAG: hypothetical protein OXH76_07645 [Boseongicola sp.]|nr:hypothetical protein [Boseongicola sp.]MYH56595.1 hypothetical protein [Boseongicola sp. SB0675_bin_26]
MREVHRCTHHLDKIIEVTEIGCLMLGLPDDSTIRQLTIVNNGDVPQCSYTCVLPESLSSACVDVGAAVSFFLRAFSCGSISLWLVFNIALV